MNIYIKFLSLAHAVDRSSMHVSQADETSKQLLGVIATRHSEGKTMSVTEAMALRSIASQATIHRKLDDLREAGLIELVFHGKNRRTKYIVPTDAANKYFSEIGSAIKNACETG